MPIKIRANPNKDWRSSRKKWADTLSSASPFIHHVVDLMAQNAVLWREGTKPPRLGNDKHSFVVPLNVFKYLVREKLAIKTARKKCPSGLFKTSYTLATGAADHPAVLTSRATERHQKHNVGQTKSSGKTPFEL